MNRRRPQPNYAAVQQISGEDRHAAVLRKAASAAIAALAGQRSAPLQENLDTPKRLRAFVAAYLLGYARHVALSLGTDCESDTGLRGNLVTTLCLELPTETARDVASITFAPRDASGASRAGFRALSDADEAASDAGYLVGHLEAMCGSRHLVEVFAASGMTQAEAGISFLTKCDNAADPMQTRAPTLSLRFGPEERAAILKAFDAGGAV